MGNVVFKTISSALLYAVGIGVAAIVATGFASQATAQEQALAEQQMPASDEPLEQAFWQEPDPHRLVSETTQSLIDRFKVLNSAPEKPKSSEYLAVVEEFVGPVVDFELIAKRVMSKYYKQASDSQKARFTAVFRESLLSTYAKGMAAYSDEKINILPFSGVRKKGSRVRASIDMEIYSSSGKVYPLQYALYQNAQGHWKLENLVLNGVNIGLTFRNQFNEAVRKNKGDLDSVISDWNVQATGA